MAIKEKSALDTQIAADLADNTAGDISAEDVRNVAQDVTDSMANLTGLAPDITEARKRTGLERIGAIEDAFGGLPQASADYLGREVTNWQTGAKYICVNDPHKSSISEGTFTDVTRNDLEISSAEPTPVLDEYWINTSNWTFWTGVNVRTGVVGWVSDRAADVLENSAETGRATIHWMGDYHDHQAALDDLHSIADGTSYFYGNNRDGHVYRLTASTFTAAGMYPTITRGFWPAVTYVSSYLATSYPT